MIFGAISSFLHYFSRCCLKNISESYLEHFQRRYCSSSFFQFILIDKVPKDAGKLTTFLTWFSAALLSGFGMLHAGI